MRPLEEREQGYLFKLKLTKNVKRLIERCFANATGPMRAKAGKAGTAC